MPKKKVEYKSEPEWTALGLAVMENAKPNIKQGIELFSSKDVKPILLFSFRNEEKNIFYADDAIDKPKNKKPVGVESSKLKTFDGWKLNGYSVMAGEKSKITNADGKALFTDKQVKYAVKSTYNKSKTSYWEDVGDVDEEEIRVFGDYEYGGFWD